MSIFHRVVLRFLGCMPAVLLGACAVPGSGPPPAAIDNVRSVEIQYQYSGWSHADEVHRLQRSGGQRAFTRTSMAETADGVETTRATVPAQRVGELVWALSAPPWPRERAVQVVARRVPPARMMENAVIVARDDVPGCSKEDIRNRMFAHLSGAALRTQLDAYYQKTFWTDDYPVMRVVISFRNAPDRVISSRSQRLFMLPWTLGDLPPPGTRDAGPYSWSLPVSDALRRLLPTTSQAAQRLAEDTDRRLATNVADVAELECMREHGDARAAP
ncbi:hypothetical protein J7J08_10410 [Stenotrophomonas sp. ISL-67]|uniref:hypothetical protein n=1 Tax=Stenotrophomonas sp. ISL-67 TaxID=2819171 RepID=UPI001BEA827D|nr:hypothetical protein [Stenotrophomonas sp. ISL-67]MBT2768047.1 hypothetical protein [Stenotrophomonas sp. ISL-67]